jgi:hypothetical protein
MKVTIEDQINIGDNIFGLRLYYVEAEYVQKHISIAIFPVRFGMVYIDEIKRIKLQIVLFNKITLFFGLGVYNG